MVGAFWNPDMVEWLHRQLLAINLARCDAFDTRNAFLGVVEVQR